MGPVPWPADSDRAGPLAIAPAIRLNNAQRAVIEGAIDWSERWMPDGGWPAKLAEGRVSNVLVEGNRISGAVGVAIELVYASHNRIIDNEIEVAPRVGVAGERRQRRPESAVIGQFIAARPAQ